MATAQMDTVIRHLRRVVLRQDGAGRTDGQLLAAFIDQKDEAAFEVLVRRHGPIIFGVCRRVVGNHHDAEDAFQATFLVLARKASSVRPRERLANWLHGVALRTAMKAKCTTAKRRGREKQVTAMPEPAAAQQDQWRDLQPLLDQELNGLPENYRLPILLCDLEGKTITEAAQHLGWPQGSLAGRLARGRKLLAKRLARRGVVLSAGSLAAVVAQNGASAGVPTALMSSTVKAAAMFAAGQATVAGAVPATVAALAEGVMTGMMLRKLTVVAVVLALGLLTTAGTALICRTAAGSSVTPSVPVQDEKAPRNDLDLFQGEWTLEWAERDGKKLVDDQGRNFGLSPGTTIKCVCAGKQWRAGELDPYTFEIDPGVSPKTIDIVMLVDIKVHDDGKNQLTKQFIYRRVEGIYKFDGDTLTWCFNNKEGVKRPTTFETTQDSGFYTMAFKRIAAKPDPTKESREHKEQKKLHGSWVPTSWELFNEQIPNESIDIVKVTFKSDQLVFEKRNNPTETFTCKIGADQNPHLLNLTWSDGPLRGKTTEMIYQLDGTTLRLSNGDAKQAPGTITLKRAEDGKAKQSK